jgi:DNA replication ATP-dependent helicase Dna2
MILGNILHILFQFAITAKKCDKDDLSKLLMDILHKKQIISQLFEANLDEEAILKETSIYLASIDKWLKENLNLTSAIAAAAKNTTKNFQVKDICDIEESIWSPKYGFKGKIILKIKQLY